MRAARRLVIGVALSAALMAGQGVWAPVPATQAADYPSWDDIERARQNEQDKQAEIQRVKGLLADLDSQYTQAQQAAQDAQQAADDALQRVADQQAVFDQLTVQRVDAQARADQSREAAGSSIAQLYRSGGASASMNIYLSGDQAQTVLYQLGMMGRVGERSDEAYRSAVADANTAKSLEDQADAAYAELTRIADEAAGKAQQAQQAAQAAQDAVSEQQQHAADLEAQLSSLQGETAELQAQRAAGVKAEADARAKALAAAAAAAASSGSGSGSSDSDGSYRAPSSSASTTTRAPSGGAVGYPLPYLTSSSGYGMRFHPIHHEYRFHYGTDYVVPTGTPVLAIADGTVVGGGYDSSAGNYVEIRHVVDGQTIVSRSLHLSRLQVSVGQRVSKGQQIGLSGSTGAATGPHLHFEIHIGSVGFGSPLWKTAGNTVNPAVWLANH
jgi:murein DD-endopeptidase MepM/ murein hydrolase activator NlpD